MRLIEQKGNMLQPRWTDIMDKIIWKYQKLPCCFNFKYAIVRIDSHPYITINGYCNECDAILVAESENSPTDTKVCFKVKTKNSHGILHTKKRRLAGIELEKLMKNLETKKPKEVRREIAAEEMIHGYPEPAYLYTLSALSKARQKTKDKKLGIVAGISVWDSLSSVKENVEFNKFIKDIGYNKFHITYWSPEQTNLYNDIQKYLGTPVSIDSTGSMVTSINRPNGESNEIFLHVLVTHLDNLIIPVTQTMSEKNDNNFLTWWLNDWKKSGALTPKEVVTDMSKALQNTICLAFNISTFKDYIDNCFMILQKETEEIKNLKCWLRTDIAHLTNAVRKWNCFKRCDSRVKEFFRRCVGLLSNVKSLTAFTTTLKEVFIVASNKIDTEECQKARKNLIQKIKTYKFEDKEETEKKSDLNTKTANEDFLQNNEDNDDSKKRSIFCYIENLKRISLLDFSQFNNSDFDLKNNDYYLPAFIELLSKLCLEFPAWTNVMQNYFESPHDVATSARSEAYFSDVKGSLLEERRRQRVDKILIKHCRQINIDIKLGTAAYNRLKDSKKIPSTKIFKLKDNNEHIEAIENWRGKVDIVKINYPENFNDTLLYIFLWKKILI